MIDIIELYKKLTDSDRVEEENVTLSFDEDNNLTPILSGFHLNGSGTRMWGNFFFNGKEWKAFGYPG